MLEPVVHLKSQKKKHLVLALQFYHSFASRYFFLSFYVHKYSVADILKLKILHQPQSLQWFISVDVSTF